MKQTFLQTGFLIVGGLLTTSVSFAQFTGDAQLRSRFENRQGYQNLAEATDTPAVHIAQRTRLNFQHKSDDLLFRLSIQDVRTWGDSQRLGLAGDNGSDASIDLFEGYAEFPLTSNLKTSVGRQSLRYDNQSIFSNGNWNHNASSLDALVFKYKKEKTTVHVGGTWNSLQTSAKNWYYPSNRIKNLNYLWFNKSLRQDLQYSFIHLSTGVTEHNATNKIIYKHTSGVYGKYATDSLKIEGNVYYQYGQNTDKKNISAYLLDFNLSYKFSDAFIPGIGASYISGNSKVGADLKTDNLFDPLFRSRHGYEGGLDYFSNISRSTKQGGISNYFVTFDIGLSKQLRIQNTSHLFSLAQTNANTPDNKDLGFENDVILKYKHSDVVNIETGYLFFLPTDNLKQLQGITNDTFSQFLYVQLTITPKLFQITNN